MTNNNRSFKKSDVLASLIIGLMVAILFIIAIMIKGLEQKIPFWWGLIVAIPILCLSGLYLAFLIGKRIKILFQFAKFVLVGGLNTLIDFSVLNLLMWLTNIYKGEFIIGINALSFLTAVTNSYLWNKFWTFKEEREGQIEKETVGKEFSQFVVVSLIGISLNTAIVYLITTFINPIFGLSPLLWANLAKVMATVISLVWNFIGYKFIVFRRLSAFTKDAGLS